MQNNSSANVHSEYIYVIYIYIYIYRVAQNKIPQRKTESIFTIYREYININNFKIICLLLLMTSHFANDVIIIGVFQKSFL